MDYTRRIALSEPITLVTPQPYMAFVPREQRTPHPPHCHLVGGRELMFVPRHLGLASPRARAFILGEGAGDAFWLQEREGYCPGKTVRLGTPGASVPRRLPGLRL